jgi:hypothetical protein
MASAAEAPSKGILPQMRTPFVEISEPRGRGPCVGVQEHLGRMPFVGASAKDSFCGSPKNGLFVWKLQVIIPCERVAHDGMVFSPCRSEPDNANTTDVGLQERCLNLA